MKKIFIVLLSFLIFVGCSQDNKIQNLSLIEKKLKENNFNFNGKIKLGYCPTMQKYIDEVVDKDIFELVKFSSTKEVLNNLKNDNIGVALIGRIAKNYEIDNNTKIQKLLDEERYTYISDNKIGILDSQIPKYQDKIKLISWNNWRDEYELAVIFNQNGSKVEKYRLPTLYFKK